MTQGLGHRAQDIAEKLKARGLTIITVESCTIGVLAALLSEGEGASDWLWGGLLTYSKAAKTALAGVPAALIDQHGAVSREVAEAMAQGGLARCDADVAVSVTGCTGPEPDEDGTPVGVVFVAASRRNGLTVHARHAFSGSVGEIRSASIHAALDLVEPLLGEPSEVKSGV